MPNNSQASGTGAVRVPMPTPNATVMNHCMNALLEAIQLLR